MGQIGGHREGGVWKEGSPVARPGRRGGSHGGERREGLSAGDSGGRERLSPAFLLESKSQGCALAR